MPPFLFVHARAAGTNNMALRSEGRMNTGGESVIRTRDLRIMIPSL